MEKWLYALPHFNNYHDRLPRLFIGMDKMTFSRSGSSAEILPNMAAIIAKRLQEKTKESERGPVNGGEKMRGILKRKRSEVSRIFRKGSDSEVAPPLTLT
jgi:hypothetical protein